MTRDEEHVERGGDAPETEKPRYEAPQLIDLGELARAMTYCPGGRTDAEGCGGGRSAGGACGGGGGAAGSG